MKILLFDDPLDQRRAMARALMDAGVDVVVDGSTDLTVMRAVRERVVAEKPNAVVMRRALDDKDAAHRDPDQAFRMNAEGPIHLAAAALEARAVPVLFSSAGLFSPTREEKIESDDLSLADVWSESRARGETFLLRAAKDALVLRTGPIILDSMLSEYDGKRCVVPSLLPGAWVSPIWVGDVACALVALLNHGASGIFHIASMEPPVRWIDVVSEVARAFELDPDDLTQGARDAAVGVGSAPLSGQKLHRFWTGPFMPYQQAIKRVALANSTGKENKRVGHRQDVKEVKKPWGHEIIWAKSQQYVGKLLFIRSGERLSLQYHEKKDETVYVLTGKMVFEVGPRDGPREDLILKPGDAYRITPHTVHRMIAIEDTQILEASTPELDDVVRLEDKYGREGTSTP